MKRAAVALLVVLVLSGCKGTQVDEQGGAQQAACHSWWIRQGVKSTIADAYCAAAATDPSVPQPHDGQQVMTDEQRAAWHVSS